MTTIKLEFEKGGVFHARLLEDEAPKSCQAILNHLDFEYEFNTLPPPARPSSPSPQISVWKRRINVQSPFIPVLFVFWSVTR